ncbi:arad-like aldolase/epimerase [Gonapodya prolifera JEL478]|uniref:Arad-like aldolase/epimerase n=1 Tax=Gonapodya prolifera (strain JEL478) TaxID=1344416 RepID=A0A139AUV3_GONPJ|nr:arad-like aldolase/epimerase [Gonapodya prolifera JEL478]|eukprot:KXS20363.1 arad-like aldolase/epimerase [Gonapodya prolifera JEL478]
MPDANGVESRAGGAALTAEARLKANNDTKAQGVEGTYNTMSILPKFKTVEDERLHLKISLAAAFRIMGDLGYDVGVAGHGTFRDPEFPECFWMNPIAVHFSDMTVGELVLVNQHGEVIQGNRPINAAGFAIHAGIYRVNQRVKSIVHNHSMYGKSFSVTGRTLLPITQDACAFYERQALYNTYEGVVLDTDEGELLGKLLGEQNHLVILQNHGLLTAGSNPDEMAWWFISADQCAQSEMIVDASGQKKIVLSHDVAVKTRAQVGTPLLGWYNFQPYKRRILKQYPELLDATAPVKDSYY